MAQKIRVKSKVGSFYTATHSSAYTWLWSVLGRGLCDAPIEGPLFLIERRYSVMDKHIDRPQTSLLQILALSLAC